MSFFGIEVAPGEPAYFHPDDECPCVRIKRAALIVRGDTIEDGARVLVKCRIAKGALCAVHLVAQTPRPSRLHRHTGADLTLDPTHRSAARASIPHPRPTGERRARRHLPRRHAHQRGGGAVRRRRRRRGEGVQEEQVDARDVRGPPHGQRGGRLRGHRRGRRGRRLGR